MHVLGRKTRIALLGVMVVANGYTTASAWSSARASIGTGSAAAMVHPTASPHPTSVPARIPRAAFVQVEGSDLVVTTNTGAAPQRSDTYYYVRDGHVGLAPPRVVAAVRAACTGTGRR